MNAKKLLQIGVHPDCIKTAIQCIQASAKGEVKENPKKSIPLILQAPETFLADPVWQPLAQAVLNCEKIEQVDPIGYLTWGDDLDAGAHKQMQNACELPISRAAALMPDAHVGYGLPIGGVLACEDAVIPYGVGVDIACRVKLTVTDLPFDLLAENDSQKCAALDRALEFGTVFGAGRSHTSGPQYHEVLDEDWSVTAVTRRLKDRAVSQLGTSGSGNHFVEWGLVELPDDSLGIPAGRYVGLLSHSGSRGSGAEVCRHYTTIARQNAPATIRKDSQKCHLAWLDMNSEAGQEYWAAMNLMGRYASANHAIIHRYVMQLAGAEALATVENHHNFAWIEKHGDRELYVHRKGATPAGTGDLGIIPGNMADACYIVRGKGELRSLNSASHGAGRRMSRTAAKKEYRWRDWVDVLKERRVRLLAGGIDEVPGVYKDIREVMAAQTDLVETLGQFTPRIVMMCGDDSPAED